MFEVLLGVIILILITFLIVLYRGGAIDKDKAKYTLDERLEDSSNWLTKVWNRIKRK